MEGQIQEQKRYKAPMVLGIVNLFSWFIPLIGVITGIFGILVSRKRLKEQKFKAYKIGLILSIIGLVLSLLNWVLAVYLAYTNGLF
ncbi:hypothetical protein K0040_05955 [Terrisporobacter petrolearius]|uniref:hypothetical protein n=1 Tax=Terrisporobacter petrolearius TaxID=1460447 RepID=UPI001D163412|nr:hypothetical protein [Terrisporobacter petrolearius]MCC3863855.1 hypothetical protein [Terrisporobacter petrolearius]